MNCKLNIKADNGVNSKLYKDIINTVQDTKEAIDMYYYTKTDAFKEAYQGTFDENGEPKYSEISKEKYLDDVDYNNIELNTMADVYKALVDDVSKMRGAINSRLQYLKDTKGNKEQITRLNEVKDVLDNQPINRSVPKFVEMTSSHIAHILKVVNKEVENPNYDIKKLASLYKISQSYSVVTDLKQALTVSPEASEIFKESLNKMVFIESRINTIQNLYVNKSMDYLAEEFHKRNPKWSKKAIKENLKHSPRDISWTENMLEYMGDSQDKVLATVAEIMMEAEHSKRVQMIDFGKELQGRLEVLEKKFPNENPFEKVIVQAPNGELHVPLIDAKQTNGKNILSDIMASKISELSNQPELLEFLDFYHNTVQQLEASLPLNAHLGTRVPSVLRSDFELLEGKTVKEKVALIQDNVAKKIQRSNMDLERGALDITGKPLKRIPTFYTQRYDSVDYNSEFNKVKKKLLEEGKSLEEAETEANRQAENFAIGKMSKIVSRDLASSLQAFHAMAVNYSTKNELIHIFESAETVVGSKFRTYTLVDSAGRKQPVTGETAATARLLKAFLEMQLYGQKQKDIGSINILGKEIDTNKVLRQANNYTGLVMQSANVLGGINNFAIGEYTNLSEAISGEYFNMKDYTQAGKFYHKNIFGLINDTGKRTPDNIINLLEEHYNILQSFEGPDLKTTERSKAKRLMKTSSLYLIQSAGEHSMQIRAALAMMNNLKMYDKAGNKKGSLLENHTSENGRLKIPSDLYIKDSEGKLVQFDQKQQNKLSNKMTSVLRLMHGNYSTTTANRMQQDARTALMMKFKGWVYDTFRRRYAKKRSYNMLDDKEVEGFYRTGGRALWTLAKDLKSFSLELSKENWKSLTPHEKANIKRFITETSFITLTGIAGALLSNAGKMMDDNYDMNDPRDRAILGAFQMVNYEVNRLYTETFSYINPAETVKLFATPAASVSLAQNLADFLIQLTSPLEQYESGSNKDQYKAFVKAQKLVPLYKQLSTLNVDGIKDRGMYYIN